MLGISVLDFVIADPFGGQVYASALEAGGSTNTFTRKRNIYTTICVAAFHPCGFIRLLCVDN